MAIETPSKIGIISKAAILLGEEPVQSLTEDRYVCTVGANLFEMFLENEVQSNNWRFCMKKRAMSVLVDVPLNQWSKAFQLPTDCLLPKGVWPRGTPYRIYGQHLYTNAASLDLDYLFKPDVDKLPAYFALLMTLYLAKMMAKPVTESDSHEKKWSREYSLQRDRALYADAQAHPAEPVQDNPFIDNRG